MAKKQTKRFYFEQRKKEITVPLGKKDKKTGELILYSPRALAEGKLIPMEKFTKGNHIIDKCPKTGGIWLDKEEVERTGKIGFFRYVIDYFKN